MAEFRVRRGHKEFRVMTYEPNDEDRIVDRYFIWRMAALLADKVGYQKPGLPQTFSEPMCCFVGGLAHNLGASGPDAFKLNDSNNIESTIEIKGTSTQSGFQEVKRTLNFDELYWLSFPDLNSLAFEIYRFPKRLIQKRMVASGKVNLMNIVREFRVPIFHQGRIGIRSLEYDNKLPRV